MSSRATRRPVLGIAVSVFGLVQFVPAAYAQDAAPQSAQTAAADDNTQSTIVVTGSRIRRPDYSTASPTVSLGSQLLEQSGTTNVTDFLTSQPALIGSSTSRDNSGDRAGIGTTGLNLLNLRNLGTQRTLVLVDGRRHVSGLEGTQAVDINTIPEDLIERIDVLTGGASAIYGADAVTGVVNFVLKKNFEGFTAHAQAGATQYGDAGSRFVGVTWGKNFAGGRGNIAIAYEYGSDDRLTTHDRPQYTGTNLVSFLRNAAYNPNNPQPGVYSRVPVSGARYAWSSRAGAVDVNFYDADGNFQGAPQFLGTGAPYNLGTSIGGLGAYSVNSDDTLVSDYGNDLRPSVDRHVVNLIAHYDFSPAFQLYGEAKYAHVKAFSLSQPTFDYYNFISSVNPYIPASIRAAIVPYTNGETVTPEDGVLLTRDNFDLGQRGENITRQTYRTVIGARGDLSPHLHYDASYVFGQTDVVNHFVNDRYTDRFLAALDAVTDPATGKVTCAVNLDPNADAHTTFSPGSCVPLNLFGEGVASPAALNFVRADTTEHSRLVQHVANFTLSGDTGGFFNLPGGSVGFAVGAEYRYEGSTFRPDPLEIAGATFSNQLLPSHGSYSVKEGYAEIDLPLLKDRPFFQTLDVSGAIRVSDYTSIGTTTAWKVDGTWAPVRDLKFRGTYSRSVRAPNISELYGASSQTFAFFNDPCNPDNIGGGTTYRAANCTAILTAAGANPVGYEDTRTVNIAGIQGGNPSLRPETSRTWTAGLVLQPRFIRGLSVSFDWYNMNLTQAINTVDPQLLAELCVDQPTIQNQFCDRLTRQQGTGFINGFTIQPQNVASFKTAGLDVNVTYGFNWAHVGHFDLKFVGNYLDKLLLVGTPGAAPTDERGQADYYSPKYQFYASIGYRSGPIGLTYSLSWFDKTLRYSPDKLSGIPNYVAPQYVYVKPRAVHNIYASFDVGKQFSFYGGITNLFNQMPEIGYTTYPTEAMGRSFFVGARVKY